MKYSVDIDRSAYALAYCFKVVNDGIEDICDWTITINAGGIDYGIYFNFDSEKKVAFARRRLSSVETATTRNLASSNQSGSASYTASSSRMHGLHEVDQNETIIGVPSLRSSRVLKASPLEFSTTTDGTCAVATTDTNSAIERSNVLIFNYFQLFT